MGIPMSPLFVRTNSIMKITIDGAARALRAFVQARGGHTVDEATLKGRMDICSAPCPMRRLIRMRPSDQASRILGLLSNSHRVPEEVKDYRCGVCGCALSLLGPALPQDLHRDSAEEAQIRAKKAPNCWLPKALKEAEP